MALIPITRGHVVIADDEDVRWLKLFSWAASIGRDPTRVYAVTRRGGRKAKFTYMHRIIVDCPEGMVVDHINDNSLDNRKCNLRICTMGQNVARKRSLTLVNKNGFRGVYLKHNGKFYVRIQGHKGGPDLCGGKGYDTPEDAGRRYDELARERFGEFARTNFEP